MQNHHLQQINHYKVTVRSFRLHHQHMEHWKTAGQYFIGIKTRLKLKYKVNELHENKVLEILVNPVSYYLRY